jgi:hypothetical protein
MNAHPTISLFWLVTQAMLVSSAS